MGAKKREHKPESMAITAYRFEMIPVEILERTGSWKTAKIVEKETAEAATYVIPGLQHGTDYKVRVASINIAGLSDYTPPQEFRTYPVKLPSNSSTTQTPSILLTFVVLLIVSYCQRKVDFVRHV